MISRRKLLAASLLAGPALSSFQAVAADPAPAVEQAIAGLERRHGGRLGVAILDTATAFGSRGLSEAQALAEPLARQAVILDDTDAEGRACLGWVALMRGDYQAALSETKRALELAPNLALALEVRGAALNFSGQPEEGVAILKTCIRLDPSLATLPQREHKI